MFIVQEAQYKLSDDDDDDDDDDDQTNCDWLRI